MNLYIKFTAKPYSFLIINATIGSDNSLCFKKNLVEKLTMTIDDKIRDEKLPHSVNREKAKRSALSSGKIDKYEFFTGE